MTKQAPPSLNLKDFLPYRLSVLTNKVSRAFSKLYSERFGISIPEWRVMAVLGQEPRISADEVCARTEMDKVTVSRAVSRLLEKGYLSREFSKRDRRRSVLQLSRSGYGVYARIVPLARAFEEELISSLSPVQRQELDRLLAQLNARASRALAPGTED